MGASFSFKSSNGVCGASGLNYVVLMKVLDEIAHIGAHHFPVCPVGMADFVGNSCFVVSPLHQLEDLGSDNVEAKHLPVEHVKEDPSVHRFGSPDCVGYPEHC